MARVPGRSRKRYLTAFYLYAASERPSIVRECNVAVSLPASLAPNYLPMVSSLPVAQALGVHTAYPVFTYLRKLVHCSPALIDCFFLRLCIPWPLTPQPERSTSWVRNHMYTLTLPMCCAGFCWAPITISPFIFIYIHAGKPALQLILPVYRMVLPTHSSSHILYCHSILPSTLFYYSVLVVGVGHLNAIPHLWDLLYLPCMLFLLHACLMCAHMVRRRHTSCCSPTIMTPHLLIHTCLLI